ncbi:MAG: NRDE family protein [Chitinophagales bacterium]
MCTVSFLPMANGNFILTSNRDETRLRKTLPPQTETTENSKQLLYPKDEKAGGTWICASEKDQLICLLNGAFEKHKRVLPYRKSRGTVVLEFFEYENAHQFLDNYDLDNIEPFTLVIYDNGFLAELKWDGQKKHIRNLDTAKTHIWSSATLYNDEMKVKRESWFETWLAKKPVFMKKTAMYFHETAGDGNEFYALKMNRFHLVETVSITCVERKNDRLEMTYKDFVNQQITKTNIEIANTAKLLAKP